MNILLASNSDAYRGVELVVYSLLTHNKNVNIYIFTMDIFLHYADGSERHFYPLTEWETNKLKKIVAYLDPSSNICFIDVTNEYLSILSGSVNEGCAFTPYASLRLLADIVLPDVDHVLYLDCDTAIQADISSMYNDCVFGDKDCYASYAYDACGGYGEMVSGIFFMKLNVFRKKRYLEQARDLYMHCKYKYPDQMALRDTIKDIGRLPETYGYLQDLASCGYTPAILHFTNKLAPKVYAKEYPDIRTYFYNKYPQLKYVKDGCELLDTINMSI